MAQLEEEAVNIGEGTLLHMQNQGGRGRTALIVIDMSVSFVDGIGYRKAETVQNVRTLMTNASKSFDLIVDVREWKDCSGATPQSTECEAFPGSGIMNDPKSELHPDLRPPYAGIPADKQPTITFVAKQQYTGFYSSTLDATLRAAGVDTLFVTGIYTGCCVFTTVMDAWYRAYNIRLVEDAITDVSRERHERGLYMFTDNPGFGGSPLFRFVNTSTLGPSLEANDLNNITKANNYEKNGLIYGTTKEVVV